jgi:lipid-binding SYLF domain-containing protein
LATVGLGLAGCTTTSPSSSASPAANAGKRDTINAGVDSTLSRLYENVNGSRELVAKARGVLVFPSVISAGFWIGAQYGEGALRVNGQTTGYYSTVAGSFGLQIGAQSKALVFLFMTQEALDEFLHSQGWAAGADATVAVLKVGANGAVDTSTATSPVEAFVLTNGGLMAGVSLEGTKVSRLII